MASLLQVPDLLKSLARTMLLPTFTPTRGPHYWLLISSPLPKQQSPGICRVNSQLLPAATRGVGARRRACREVWISAVVLLEKL